jgi:hypothetical protein
MFIMGESIQNRLFLWSLQIKEHHKVTIRLQQMGFYDRPVNQLILHIPHTKALLLLRPKTNHIKLNLRSWMVQ